MNQLENAIEQWEKEAYEEGKQAAENAATWIVDGNSDVDAAKRLLQMMRDGDPAAWDSLPKVDLSGEWADDPTPQSLARDITGEEELHLDIIDALADAFEAGVSEHLEQACEAELIKFTS